MSLDNLYEYWRAVKSFVRFSGNVDAGMAHVHFGLFGFFVFLAVFRKVKHPELTALFCVFVVQFSNECIDMYFDFTRKGSLNEWNSIEDFMLTLFWPSILVVFLLFRSNKFPFNRAEKSVDHR